MAKSKPSHPRLTLTGNVFDRRDDDGEESFHAGDVAVYTKSDMYGRMAQRGGHTNYGFSGYFRASVFDGKRWRNFKIWNFVPEEDRKYAKQGDVVAVKDRLTTHLEAREGSTVVWTERTYQLEAAAQNG